MAGEVGRWAWWDCEATTPTGLYLLGSLFPCTAPWTGIACALETAAAAVESLMPRTPHLHLFALDEATEGRCAQALAAARAGGRDPADSCAWPLEEGAGDLDALFTARLGLSLRPTQGPAGNSQVVQVGAGAGPHPLAGAPGGELDDILLLPLIAGFLHSAPGRVAAPHLRWDR